jgi:hypothetical protein
MPRKVNRWKNIPLVPALGALLLTGGAAGTWSCENCDQRIHKAEENLRKAIELHGEHSGQAEKRRHELEETKRSCGR